MRPQAGRDAPASGPGCAREHAMCQGKSGRATTSRAACAHRGAPIATSITAAEE